MKWIGQHIYDQISRFRNDVIIEDIDGSSITMKAGSTDAALNHSFPLTMLQPVNDASPSIILGSSIEESLEIRAFYQSGTQEMQVASFGTKTAETDANRGMFKFSVDGTNIVAFLDDGIDLYTGKGISINGTDILTDSSGTATLSNIDALDATTIATFETAMEANLDTFGSQMTSASSLATIGTITTGVWEGTDVGVAHGGTGASTLSTGRVLVGNGTGSIVSTHLEFINDAGESDTSTLSILSNQDFGDRFTIATTTHGATTLTTIDDDATAAHFEIAADGDIILDSAGQIKLDPVAGNNILLDGTIAVDAGVVTGATSITSTAFVGALTGQADTVATIAGLAPNTATTQATQGNITTLAGLTSFGAAGATTNIVAGDLTMYNPVNAGNPSFAIGANSGDRFTTYVNYNSSAQTLDSVYFYTNTTSGTTNDGRFLFYVDEVSIFNIIDSGVSVNGVVSSTGDGSLLRTTDTTASSATQGGKLELQSDDGAAMGDDHRLGVIEFKGAEDASATRSIGARIQAICRDAWDGSNNDADLEFYTTDGTTESKVLTLDADKLATFTGTVAVAGLKGTGATTVTNILDEDAMGSDSATALATQQSIKAYADRPAKQIVLMRAAFKDDIGTAKHYIPLQSELEQTNSFHEMNSFVAPFAGKLLKLMYNGSGNFSGGEFSFTLEQIPRNVAFSTTPTVLETIAIDGPTNNTTDPNMIIADFAGGSGTNSFTAGDMIMVGIQSDTDVTSGTSKHFFTLVFEFDFSGLA